MNEIGLEDSISELMASWLQPVAAALFPGIGSRLDSHHSVSAAAPLRLLSSQKWCTDGLAAVVPTPPMLALVVPACLETLSGNPYMQQQEDLLVAREHAA